MATEKTIACTFNGYNAFNKSGNGIYSASWDGWNAGPNTAGKYGYAGVRANTNIRYAFVYKFTTPSWVGNMTKIEFSYYMQEELGSNRTVNLSLTTTDPTTSTTLYTAQTLPTDSGRIATAVQTVTASQTLQYTFTVTGQLSKNKAYYLVISPATSSGSNYATIPYYNFSATITYEASASAVSANDGDIGSAITITMTNDGLSHKLTYSFGGSTGVITSGTTASSYSWTPALSMCNLIPSKTSDKCTITCTTSAGTTSCEITLYVPASITPMISSTSMSPVNSNSVVNQWGIYLQNYSKVRVRIIGQATCSTIASWRIELGAVSFEGTASSTSVNVDKTSDILTAAGTYSATVTVTDARGRTATETIKSSWTVESYTAPNATNVTVYRCTKDGTRDDQNGTYLYAKANSVYSKVGLNSCSMNFQYKERSASDYTYIALTDGVGLVTGGGEIDVLKNYTARIYVSDRLTGNYVTVVISSQTVSFNLKPTEKSGAAFGMYAEDDEVLELAASWSLRVNSISKILFQSATLKSVLLQMIYPVGSYFFTSQTYANSAAVNAALGLESSDAYWVSVSGQFTNCWRRSS